MESESIGTCLKYEQRPDNFRRLCMQMQGGQDTCDEAWVHAPLAGFLLRLPSADLFQMI